VKLVFLLALLLIGSCSTELPKHNNLESAQHNNLIVTRLTLPQQCNRFSREPDPATWDEEKHEYPSNDAWERCMLVERK